jgi:hypothetical protein
MMTAAEVWQWIGTVVAGVALVATVTILYLAILRCLIVIVPGVVLVGFAFEPGLQLRFTATLLGVLAILYLPPLVLAWVWRQVIRSHAVSLARITPPSALEIVHQTFADDLVRERFEQRTKTASEARDQDERDSRARDLERQGMVSLWSGR